MITVERLAADPFFREWAAKGHRARVGEVPLRVESVADVLGERVSYALTVLSGQIPTKDPQAAASLIMGAQPVFWEDGLARAAANMELPRHTVAPDVMPMDAMWWAFPSTLSFAMENGSSIDLQAVLIHVRSGAIEVDGFTEPTPGTLIFGRVAAIKHRDVYPKPHGTIENIFLAMLAFMQSPLLTTVSERRMKRSERRRFPGEASTATVSVVALRRSQYHAVSTRRDDADDREYRVRWIVSGHLRAQWYPSLQAHRLIWIQPYVKGPESAPLKQTVYKVVR